MQRVRAEIKVLNLRPHTNREKIDKINSNVNTFLTIKIEDQELIDELKKNWQEKNDHDQKTSQNNGPKRSKTGNKSLKKDKAILTSSSSQQMDPSMSTPVDTNSEQSRFLLVPYS